MSNAVELAQVWVPLMPEASRIAAGVEKIGKEAASRFNRQTQVMGSAMAKSIDTHGAKVVESLRKVERQTISVQKARKADADALGRLELAQKRYQQVSSNAKATELQRATAAESVARAQRTQELTADGLTRATKGLTQAQKAQASAQREANAAQAAASRSGARTPLGYNFSAAGQQAERAGTESATRFAAGFKKMIGPAMALVGGAGLFSTIKQSVKAGVDMESNLNRLQGVTGASAQMMAKASEKAQQLGADTTIVGASAADAAAAMLELAKSGLNMNQAMGAAPGTLRLAAAASIDAATAAEAQGNIINAYQLKAEDANHVADALAGVANAAAGEVPDFMLGLQQAATVAHGFGISMDDTVATLGLFANAGIRGSDAGTSLKTMLTHLAAPSDQAGKAMDALGLNIRNTKGEFVGMRELFRQIGEASSRMRPDDFQENVATVFGTDAIRGAMIAGSQGIQTLDKMTAAVTKEGNAAAMAAANMQGVPGVMEKISNATDGAKLAFYDLLKPALQSGGDKLLTVIQGIGDSFTSLKKGTATGGLAVVADVWRDISGAAKDLAPTLGKAIKALATGAGGVAVVGWQALGMAIKAVEPPLRIIADLFGSNQWLSTGLMAAFAMFIAKTKLLPPVLNSVNSTVTRAKGVWSELRTPLNDVKDRTTGLVTQQGLLTRATEGTLGPVGRMRAAYLEGAQQAKTFAQNNTFLRTQLVQNVGPLQRIQQAGSNAVTSIRGMSTVMGAARAAGSGLSMAAGGLMSALGGPWGIAIMGATALLGGLAAAHADAARKAGEQQAAENALKDTLAAGRLTERTRHDINTALGERKDGAPSALDREQSFKLPAGTVLGAATGSDSARALLNKTLTDNLTAAGKGNGDVQKMLDTAQAAGISTEELSKALSKEGFNWDIVTQKLKAYNDAQQAALEREHPGGKVERTYEPVLRDLDQLMAKLPDAAESAATMNQQMNQQALTATRAAEGWAQENRSLNGVWEASARGVEAFKALGAAVVAVPSDKQIVVSVPDEKKAAFMQQMKDIGNTVEHLPNGEIVVTANDDAAVERWKAYVKKVEGTPVQVPIELQVQNYDAALKAWVQRLQSGQNPGAMPQAPVTPGQTVGGRATGGRIDPSGRISGPGSGTSDSILAQVMGGGFVKVSNKESVNTAASTAKNWPLINAMNNGYVPPIPLLRDLSGLKGYAEGGAFALEDAAEGMVGTPYSQGARNDCSGSIAQLVNAALGGGDGSLMTTKTAATWLAARGFKMGNGPAGSFRIGWYDHGPNPNDGHMAATLPDGRNVESGGKNGVFTLGAGAAGASDPQFDQHMYLPEEALYPEGSGGSGGGGFGGGSYGGGGGGYGGSGGGPTRAEQRALRNAAQKVDDTAKAVEIAKQHLDEVNANPKAKPSAQAAAQERLNKAEREHQDALDDQASKQEEVNEKSAKRGSRGTGRGDGTGDGGPDGKSFGKDLLSGAMEVLGFDGSVFSDPTQWGIWKLGTGGANYLGGLAKNVGTDEEGNRRMVRRPGDDPSRTQHIGTGGLPGPSEIGGVGDGGFGNLATGLLDSVLPQASDWLPNATNGGGTTNTNTTNNSNSNNTTNTGVAIYGPVTMQAPAGMPSQPDRIATRQTGLPR
ncbi:phage tail tape measure protein [Mycobacterium sp. SMC-17]|uniref:phage tail tape measure protein n=1 Tax=Mycobacterium sp. SMC-17 TaxID=3381628 RepID=UPI0038767E78